MTWVDTIPTVKQMDVLIGTPVKIKAGREPAGWVVKEEPILTVRPWGDEHETHCLVVDVEGSSIPIEMDRVVIDLDHPLGFASALLILRKLHPSKDDFEAMAKLRNAWLFGPNDEDRRILASSLVRHLNQTHREV